MRELAETSCVLARTIHEYLLRRPILSPGGAFLVRSSRRTASTPPSAMGYGEFRIPKNATRSRAGSFTCEQPRQVSVSNASRRHS